MPAPDIDVILEDWIQAIALRIWNKMDQNRDWTLEEIE